MKKIALNQLILASVCSFALLGGCSGGGSDSAEAAADGGSGESADDGAGGGGAEGDSSGDQSASCTPIPVGSRMLTLAASTLTDGCVDDAEPITMVPANKDQFNLQLDKSEYAAGDGNNVKGIYIYSTGGGVSLINPYWLIGETEYTYNSAVMPVIYGADRFYMAVGPDFGLYDYTELNLGVIGTVGDPEVGPLDVVEIAWVKSDEELTSGPRLYNRAYSVSGMPNGILYATSDNPLRHLTWLLAQDIDERLAQMYNLSDNCPEEIFSPRIRAQWIDATGELTTGYVHSEQEVRYSVDLQTTHHVYTIDWNYLDDTGVNRLVSEVALAIASANGCRSTLAAPLKHNYSALRQDLLSGDLSDESQQWSY